MTPDGAITTQAALEASVSQAKQTCIPIPLYAVEQGGSERMWYITEESEIFPGITGSFFIKLLHRYNSNEEYYTELSLHDANIPENKYNRHYWFYDQSLASKYAETLRNDKDYQEEVRRHHAWCDRLFRNF